MPSTTEITDRINELVAPVTERLEQLRADALTRLPEPAQKVLVDQVDAIKSVLDSFVAPIRPVKKAPVKAAKAA